MQASVIITCLTFAMVMISESVSDWNQNPVVTNIENVEAPNQDIPFPAITACPEEQHHESWEIPEKIFNAIDLKNCTTEDCQQYENVTEYLDGYEDFFAEVLTGYLSSEDYSEGFTTDNVTGEKKPIPGAFYLPEGHKGLQVGTYFFRQGYCDLGKKMSAELDQDPNLISNLTYRWANSLITSTTFNLDVLLDEYQVVIDLSDITMMDGVLGLAFGLDVDMCDEGEDVIWSFLGKLYFFEADLVLHNFGSTLRHFFVFGKLDITPYRPWYPKSHQDIGFLNKTASDCLVRSKEDDFFHDQLKAVAKSFGGKVSMFDVPRLFDPDLPKLPVHVCYWTDICATNTFCLIDPYVFVPRQTPTEVRTDSCAKIWKNCSTSSCIGQEIDKNPYQMEQKNSICGHGLGEKIG